MPICAIQHRSVTGKFVPIQIKILSRRGPCFDKHNFVVHWLEWQVKHLRKNLYAKFKHADKVYISGDNFQILFKPHKIASEKLHSDHVTFQNVTEGDCNAHNDHVTSLETEGSKKDCCSLVNKETTKTCAKQNNKLYRDSCGRTHSRHTSTSIIVPCEKKECTSLSKCVCGSDFVSTSCSRKKKLTGKNRRKYKHHLTMLKQNVCEAKEDCYHGDSNFNTSVLCSAHGKEKISSTKYFTNVLVKRLLHATVLLCVQLMLLLLAVVFADIVVHLCNPMMNIHSELSPPLIQPRRATTVEVEVFKCSVPEVNSFLQCGDGCNGLLVMLLLLLSGDVEVNPGPVCYGWKYVDGDTGLKTIKMRNWKQLPADLCQLDDLQSLVIWNHRSVPLEQISQTITRLHRIVRLEIIGDLTTPLFPITWMQTIQQLVSLQQLVIWNYNLSQCGADGICSLTNLQKLSMWHTNLSSLPAGISELKNLQTLDLSYNKLTSLPEVISELKNLEELNLAGNQLKSLPEGISALKKLQELGVSRNNIKLIPPSIQSLQCLKKLELWGNPVTHLPVELSDLPQLIEIKVIPREYDIGGPCPLVQPPIELCKQGTPAVLQYLKDLKKTNQVSTSNQRLLFLGETIGGKTSLCQTLLKGKPEPTASIQRTKVLEQLLWSPEPGIEIQLNDFGGHDCYQITHQLFFTPKAISLLLFNLESYKKGGEEVFEKLIGSWLRNLNIRLPGAKVLLVASHSDKINTKKETNLIINSVKEKCAKMEELRIEEVECRITKMKTDIQLLTHSQSSHDKKLSDELEKVIAKLETSKTQQLDIDCEIYVISSVTYNGIEKLKERIFNIVKERKVVLPESWYEFVNGFLHLRNVSENQVYLSWKEVEDIDRKISGENDVDKTVIKMKLSYMRDIGQILFYPDTKLEKYVFFNIHLLIDIMKAVFQHDIQDVLVYNQRFGKYFSEPSFYSARDDLLQNGIMQETLMYALWQQFSVGTECFNVLVKLLKMFDLCYDVKSIDEGETTAFGENSNRICLLFPWYLKCDKPDIVDSTWSEKLPYQVTIDFHFWPEIPVTFFEIALVVIHNYFSSNFDVTIAWKNGAIFLQDDIKLLYSRSLTSSRHVLNLSIQSNDVSKLWEKLLCVYSDLKSRLLTDWPGCSYSVHQLCPHCVANNLKLCHVRGFYLDKEWDAERSILCNNGNSIEKVSTSLIIPPREIYQRVWKSKKQHIEQLHEEQTRRGTKTDPTELTDRETETGGVSYTRNMKKVENEVLHRVLILKIQNQLLEKDFASVKYLCNAYFGPAEIERVSDFCTLVDKLESRGHAVSWQHDEGYSKLIDIFKSVNLPKIVDLIEEYAKKMRVEADSSHTTTGLLTLSPSTSLLPPSSSSHQSDKVDVAAATETGERVKALFSYSAENDDELSIAEGDVVTVLDKELDDGGWWKGELNGKTGVFPDNFVELLPPEEPKPSNPAPPIASRHVKPELPPVNEKGSSEPHKRSAKKEERELPNIPAKKPVLPPPMGKKPSKPADVKLLVHTDDYKVKESKEKDALPTKESNKDVFDGLLPSPSEVLTHLTASRPKQPAKRPPSTINFKKELTPPTENHNEEQDKKPPPQVPPMKKQDSNSEESRESVRGPTRPASTYVSPLKSHEPKTSPITPASSETIINLEKQIKELKHNSASKDAFNELKKESEKLRHDLDHLKTNMDKKTKMLINDIDEEKKARFIMQVDLERLKKLVE